MNKLMQTVTENVAYVVIFLAVIVGCFLVAVVLEKSAQKKNGVSEPIFNTRKLAMIGMFSAIAMILHVLDFPIFFAPGFYKMDFSELPILVGSFGSRSRCHDGIREDTAEAVHKRYLYRFHRRSGEFRSGLQPDHPCFRCVFL